MSYNWFHIFQAKLKWIGYSVWFSWFIGYGWFTLNVCWNENFLWIHHWKHNMSSYKHFMKVCRWNFAEKLCQNEIRTRLPPMANASARHVSIGSSPERLRGNRFLAEFLLDVSVFNDFLSIIDLKLLVLQYFNLSVITSS